MTNWILLLALFGVISTTGVVGQTCPQDWFPVQFNIVANVTFPATAFAPDADFSYYRDVLKFTPEEIETDLQNAINFYATRFGLNFSTEPDESGVRRYQNATFNPIRFPAAFTTTVNRWLKNGNTRSTCYTIRAGGFLLSFTGPQMLHGTYGGVEGKPANVGAGAGYGYHSIEICPQSPFVIQFQNPIPGHPHPVDRYNTIKSDVFHRTLGQGIELGASRIVPHNGDSSMLRYEYETVVTFGGQPSMS